MHEHEHKIVYAAIARLLEKQNISVPVGKFKVDHTVTIRVNATVTRLADQEYTPTIAIPLKATLALLLVKMGFQREHASALLVEAMTEALNAGTLGSEAIEDRIADVDEAVIVFKSLRSQPQEQVI